MDGQSYTEGVLHAATADIAQERLLRLGYLEDVFIDISQTDESGQMSERSRQFTQHGPGLRRCLEEIKELRGPSAEDLALDRLRQDYLDTLFIRGGLLTPVQRIGYDSRSDELQQQYTGSVVSKIGRFIDARTPKDALRLGQLPPIIRKASFNEGEPLTMEQFTANHLHLMVDTILREHIKRRNIIEDRKNSRLRARITSSRGTRVAIGGAIGLASLAPEFSFVPRPEEVITQDLELALRGLSGVIIGINLPEYLRLKHLSRKYDEQARDNFDKLSDDRETCDHAMRIVFGSSDYGGSSPATIMTGRAGTDDKQENLHRLTELRKNLPNSRPYNSRQALGYAARLLIERKDQLQQIIDPSKSPQEQQRLYLQLCEEIITEDVRRMKKKLNVTKIRRVIMDSLGILPAIIFPAATAAASEASTLSHDTFETIKPKPSDDSEY